MLVTNTLFSFGLLRLRLLDFVRLRVRSTVPRRGISAYRGAVSAIGIREFAFRASGAAGTADTSLTRHRAPRGGGIRENGPSAENPGMRASGRERGTRPDRPGDREVNGIHREMAKAERL